MANHTKRKVTTMVEKVNKSDIVSDVAKELTLTKVEVALVVDAFLAAVSDNLCDNYEVHIAGFGKFVPRYRDARNARNPRTGETVKASASVSPKFTASKTLKDAVGEYAIKHAAKDHKASAAKKAAPKATVKPAGRAAAKPAAEPAARSAAKPVSRAAAKPAAKPAGRVGRAR